MRRHAQSGSRSTIGSCRSRKRWEAQLVTRDAPLSSVARSRVSRRVPPRGFFNGESPFGRLPTEPSFPTIRISRRGVIWIVVAAIALLILFLLKPFATLYTDFLWFRALGYGSVFGTRFAAQIWSFFIFAAIFWVIGAANVLLALNSGRRLSSIGIRQRLLTAPSTILALRFHASVLSLPVGLVLRGRDPDDPGGRRALCLACRVPKSRPPDPGRAPPLGARRRLRGAAGDPLSARPL
ncbi:MAG: hypothetical protein E6J32_00390 [Chloroflexi bacterium]|nr:MAG: hypothetical protein E6J32_00390 [Chloroflexota bacterium]